MPLTIEVPCEPPFSADDLNGQGSADGNPNILDIAWQHASQGLAHNHEQPPAIPEPQAWALTLGIFLVGFAIGRRLHKRVFK